MTNLESTDVMWLKGGTLAYTLMVCLLVSLLLSSLVMIHGLYRIEADLDYHRELAEENARSGILIALHESEQGKQHYEGTLWESGIDNYTAEILPWGVYAIVIAEGRHGQAIARRSALFGIEPPPPFDGTLFLEDRGRPLQLVGRTSVSGLCYLPETGVTRGRVGKQGFEGSALINGEVKLSTREDGKLDYTRISEAQDWLLQCYDNGFPSIRADIDLRRLYQPWSEPTLFISNPNRLNLNGCQLSGRMVICAPEIRLAKNAQLENCILLGNVIKFEPGFSGKVQAFATDSIIVQSSAHLRYPSALVLSHPSNMSVLRIDSLALVEGSVVHDGLFLGESPLKGGYTLVADGARVRGLLYAPHNLELRGTVEGTTVTGSFLLTTPGAAYENYLLGSILRPDSLRREYAMGIFRPSSGRYRLISHLKP